MVIVVDSPKETWLVINCAAALFASTSETFSLLDFVEVVVVVAKVDISLTEESASGPASVSSRLVVAGFSEPSLGPLGSSFTPRWFWYSLGSILSI